MGDDKRRRKASSRKPPRHLVQPKQTRMRAAVTVVVIAGLAGLGFLLFGGSDKGVQVGGQPAPRVSLIDFEGKRFSLAAYKGRPLVLNFWASWCPNCAAEMPAFQREFQTLGNEVAFVGIDQRDSRDGADRLAAQTGVRYRLASDPQGRVFDAFGGTGMPTTVFIDARGRVVDEVTGQLTAGLLRQRIHEAFGIG